VPTWLERLQALQVGETTIPAPCVELLPATAQGVCPAAPVPAPPVPELPGVTHYHSPVLDTDFWVAEAVDQAEALRAAG